MACAATVIFPLQGYALPVSVIMPAHNAASVLERAVASVQAQTFADWELLIVDDASGDGTLALAQRMAVADPRIRVFEHPKQKGAGAARNTALSNARGRYIAFLDADDAWLPEKLDRQLTHLAETSAPLGYSGFWRVSGQKRHAVQVPPSVDYAELLKGNCIGCLTAIYDRAVYGSVPMPDLALRQDFALWLSLLKRQGPACGLTEPLAIYHRTPGSLSANKRHALAASWRMYRDEIGLTRWQSAAYLATNLFRRLRRG